MKTASGWKSGEVAKNWAQVAAFVVAGGWALSMFIYRGFVQPQKMAILNLDVQARDLGKSRGNRKFEVTVDLENPSERRVYLLSGLVSIWGSRYQTAEVNFSNRVPSLFSTHGFGLPEFAGLPTRDRLVLRDAELSQPELIGVATILAGWNLQPKERASRSLIAVARGNFDAIWVHAAVPIAWKDGKLEASWRLAAPNRLQLERHTKPGYLFAERTRVDEANEDLCHKIRKNLGYGVLSDYSAIDLMPLDSGESGGAVLPKRELAPSVTTQAVGDRGR